MMNHHLLTGKCDDNCDQCQCHPEREDQWRPMETAPKDGTEVELLSLIHDGAWLRQPFLWIVTQGLVFCYLPTLKERAEAAKQNIAF